MKAKKILATVLALMMVISMLPVNALAAQTATATENIVNIQLTVGTKFGTTYTGTGDYGGTETVVTSPAEYNAVFDEGDPAFVGGKSLTSANVATQGPANITLADQAFVASQDTAEVRKTDTIYVGVKMKGENLSNVSGIIAGTVFLKYDPTKLQPIATKVDGIARNLAMRGLFNATSNTNKMATKEYNGALDLLAKSIFSAEGTGALAGSSVVGLSYNNGSENTFPQIGRAHV